MTSDFVDDDEQPLPSDDVPQNLTSGATVLTLSDPNLELRSENTADLNKIEANQLICEASKLGSSVSDQSQGCEPWPNNLVEHENQSSPLSSPIGALIHFNKPKGVSSVKRNHVPAISVEARTTTDSDPVVLSPSGKYRRMSDILIEDDDDDDVGGDSRPFHLRWQPDEE